MAEKRRDTGGVLYVYDRVQSRGRKEREILREYGYELRKLENERAHSSPYERPFGVDFAEAQRRRARPKRSRDDGRTVRVDGGGYVYRPSGVPRGGQGVRVAAAERTTPLKLALEKIVNMFESVEERAKNDERIAKQRAIMSKKWSDSSHTIRTVILVTFVAVLVIAAVYKFGFVIRNINVSESRMYSNEQIADASGILLGDNLYSFKSSEAESDITFRCPRIKSVIVSRSVPMNVNIDVVDDTAKYYAEIWGEHLELSAGLRVLGKVSAEDAEAAGLCKLVLPAVNYSVAGRVLGFTDARNERVVRNVLTEIESSSIGKAGEISMIDLTNEYDITMHASGLYTLRLGGENDLALKLRMMNKTMESGGLDSGVPANIDLSVVGELSVKYGLH